MAQSIIAGSKLTLVFETGVNEKGEPVFKNKAYSNIKTAATADQLLLAASALGELCAYPMSAVTRTDQHEIV